jgi:peptide/nickel transport system ATP-binding protein
MCDPDLLIADEPTTALDVTIQAQILRLLVDLQKEFGIALLLITHDLGLVARVAHRVAVMYAGEIVEIGPAREVLEHPRHPYAEGLRQTSASLERRDEYLYELPGEPGGRAPAQGCGFLARCPKAIAACRTTHPALIDVGADHVSRCLLHER